MTTTATLKDARKFVNDTGSNLPIVWSADKSQGNFHSFEAINTWLLKNNTYNAHVIIRGPVTLPDGATFSYTNKIIFEGDNATITTLAGDDIFINPNVFINKNIEFRNIKFMGPGSWTIENSIFTDCIFDGGPTLLIKSHSTFIRTNFVNNPIISAINDVNFIEFDHCLIVLNATLSFGGGASHIIFRNTNLNMDAISSGSTGIIIEGCFDFLFEDFVMSGSFARGIDFSGSNTITFRRIYLETSFTPTSGFVSADLVNTGNGNLYCEIFSSLEDIIIEDSEFAFVGSGSTRYSFINIEFAAANKLTNLKITNNKFTTIFDVEDKRAAIAIINKATSGSVTDVQPQLINAVINNNKCDKNQSIILTSILVNVSGDLTMTYPGLVTKYCEVKNNVCGAIGYWVSAGTLSTGGFNEQKTAGLSIADNICHLIFASDSTAKIFRISVGFVNYSYYPSGNVIISNNKVNWIHTGVAYEEKSSLIISKNNLTAYTQSYLNDYGDTAFSFTQDLYAINVRGNKYHSGSPILFPGDEMDSACIISDNTTSAGYFQDAFATPITYQYGGYVYATCSVNVTNNIFKGILSDATNAAGIRFINLNSIIQGNRIYRGSSNILAYVAFITLSGAFVSLNPTNPTAFITDNFFDSTTVDGTNDSTVWGVANLPNHFVFERNTNQIKYAVKPLVDETYTSQKDSSSPSTAFFQDGTGWQLKAAAHYLFGGPTIVPPVSPYLRITDNTHDNTVRKYFAKNFNFDFLPSSVKVLEIMISIWIDPTASDLDVSVSGNNAVGMILAPYKQHTVIDSTSVMDVKTNHTNLSNGGLQIGGISENLIPIDSAGDLSSFTSANYLLSLVIPATSPVLDQNFGYSVLFQAQWKVNTGSGTFIMYVSPIRIKYKW